MDLIGDIWMQVITRPMINSLVLLYYVFFNSFGLSILVFTVIVRALLIPLTIKQSRQMKAMSALQPKMKETQAKYPNDRQRQSQETMRLYKEHGVNPLGCLGPMFIQMPIFMGLFLALRRTLPTTPESLADLSRHLYPWPHQISQAVPLDSTFLWLDLAKFSSANPVPFLLPVLVGVSMFVMQKMTAMPAASSQQESTNRTMLWMMPIMFGFFTFQFEAGLALYWIMTNIMGILIQGFITGWGPLTSLYKAREAKGLATAPVTAPPAEEAVVDADHRNDGQDTRRRNRDRVKTTRRRATGRRNRRR